MKLRSSTTPEPTLQSFESWLRIDYQRTTIRGYYRWVRIFQTWMSHHHGRNHSARIEEVTEAHVVAFVTHLRSLYRPASVSAALVALSAWGRWGIAQGYRRDNPWVLPSTLRKPQPTRTPRMLTSAEMDAVNSKGVEASQSMTLRGARQHTLVLLILLTGLRVNEVCALCWGHLVLTETTQAFLVGGDQGHPHRTIPLVHTALQALWNWRTAWIKSFLSHDTGVEESLTIERFAAWIARHGTEPVFPNRIGMPLTPRMVQRDIADIAVAANVPQVTPQTLRHTFARNLIDQGVNLAEVAALLGHRTLASMTGYLSRGLSPSDIQKMTEAHEEPHQRRVAPRTSSMD